MTDIEERLTRVLHDRADGDVDAAALAAGATARGRTRRARRGIALAGAASLAALAVVAVAPSIVPVGGSGGGGGEYVEPLTAADPEVPGAAERPDLIGTDPNMLHFAVDPAVGQPVNWASAQGRETVQIKLEDRCTKCDVRLVTIDVARDVKAFDRVLYDYAMAGRPQAWTDTTVDGRPAKVGTVANVRVLRWSPAKGVWIDVSGVDETTDDLRGVAERLWLDEARRCSVPFQLTALPAGARVSGCEVNLLSFPTTVSGSVLVTSRSRTMQIHAEYVRGRSGGKPPNYQVAGRDAFLYPAHDELELLDQPGWYLSARMGKAYSGFSVDDAALVLGGLRMADPVDVGSWPTPLVKPTS